MTGSPCSNFGALAWVSLAEKEKRPPVRSVVHSIKEGLGVEIRFGSGDAVRGRPRPAVSARCALVTAPSKPNGQRLARPECAGHRRVPETTKGRRASLRQRFPMHACFSQGTYRAQWRCPQRLATNRG